MLCDIPESYRSHTRRHFFARYASPVTSTLFSFIISRYGNILPYDHNRVRLNVPYMDCDYVNASWIGEDGSRPTKIMATQGPMTHTMPYFLQMVVEQSVDCIVMLTKLYEQNSKGNTGKCSL